MLSSLIVNQDYVQWEIASVKIHFFAWIQNG